MIKGGWIGLDLIHKKEHLYKSILESIAFNRYLDLLKIKEICKFDEGKIDGVVFIGGGAKSKVWGQIISDIIGKKILKYKIGYRNKVYLLLFPQV